MPYACVYGQAFVQHECPQCSECSAAALGNCTADAWPMVSAMPTPEESTTVISTPIPAEEDAMPTPEASTTVIPTPVPAEEEAAAPGCATECYIGRNLSCSQHIQASAKGQFLQRWGLSCALAYGEVVKSCPECRVCAYVDSGGTVSDLYSMTTTST